MDEPITQPNNIANVDKMADKPASEDEIRVVEVDADTTSGPSSANTMAPNHHIREDLKKYRKAIIWTLVINICLVMEGYDMLMMRSFFAHPIFCKKYGVYIPDADKYELAAPWQVALGTASILGCFIGTLCTGYFVAMLGPKRVILGSFVLLSLFVLITFNAPNVVVMFAGAVLCGIPLGAFAAVPSSYASEIMPLSLRVAGTSATNVVCSTFPISHVKC